VWWKLTARCVAGLGGEASPGYSYGMAKYAFQNAIPGQLERLRTLEALLDAGSIRALDFVQPGWHCLEVGAGGGSIASWLCERVGRGGSVLATDLDITTLSELSRPNLEIRVHDVLADELPAGRFDVIHMRLLLAWLADPATALQRMIAALRPGGWLVAEEMDFGAVAPDPHMDEETCDLFARVAAAHNATLAARSGFDAYYGRRVVGDFEDAGLVGVRGDGRASMWRGGEAGGRIWTLTVTQVREDMAARLSLDDVDRALALFDDPRFSSLSPVVMAASGRQAD
jgi:SAM-dependent methyltransferase